MSDFYLVRKNLTRNKLRLILSCIAIFIAFLLFGVLGSIEKVFSSGVEMSADNRLITVNRINFTQSLPLAHVNKIKTVEGVDKVTWANWFGGYYQEPRNMMSTFAVDPESYLAVYEELVVPEEQRKQWINSRTGLLVGRNIANQYGWEVGDTIALNSNIFSKMDGSRTWDFEISGIFEGETARTDTSYVLLHYKYFIETQSFGSGWIGWIPLTTADPAMNEEVSKKIDSMFANSPYETETSTEAAFNKAFIEQIGDIGFILSSVVSAAFFTILLIVGNTMALAVRERTSEIAVLKTLGFSAKRIFGQVLGESVLLSLLGGLLGIGLAAFLVTGMAAVPQISRILPTLSFSSDVFLQGLAFMLLLGLVTGIIPAWRAMKLNTIDALNRS